VKTLCGLVLLLSACAQTTPLPQSDAPAPEAAHQHSCPPATIGIESTTLSMKLRAEHRVPERYRGAVITYVIPDGPAAKAGIVVGDVVLSFGNAETKDTCDLSDQVIDHACGSETSIAIWSDRTRKDLTITPIEAASFYETSCDRGDSFSCYLLGLQYKGGYGHPEDQARARALFERACEMGSPNACGHLASWQSHDAAKSDWPRLRALSTKACEGGYAPSCVDLGFMYSTGTRVARDDAASIPYFRRGCDLGDAQGCYNMGLMLQNGRGVEKDEAAALVEYEAGCAQGAPNACTNAGYMRENGIGGDRWSSKAFDLYYRGCIGSSCVSTNSEGCLNWGRAYRDGIGTTADKQHAAQIFEDLCERGKQDPHDPEAPQNIARACALLGALRLKTDPDRAIALFHRACDVDDTFACYNLGVLFSNGEHVGQSDATAADYFTRACDHGDGEACYWLSLQYRDGSGVNQDADRAKELMNKACEAGYEKACS
jgi:uncharacterized protein